MIASMDARRSDAAVAIALFIVAASCVVSIGSVEANQNFVQGHPGRPLVISAGTSVADLDLLANTTIFDGSLELSDDICDHAAFSTLMDSLYTNLNSITEIRGYLAVGNAFCMPDLGFLSSLGVIRGLYLYENEYALSVAIIPHGGATLAFQGLNLTSLQRVQRGSIRLTRDSSLTTLCPGFGTASQLPQQGANLTALLTGVVAAPQSAAGEVTITVGDDWHVMFTEDPGSCSDYCHASCDACWGTSEASCQQVCDGGCGARGCHTTTGSCCPSMCVGGCFDDPQDTTRCFACAEGFLRTAAGECVPACPANTLTAGYVAAPLANCSQDTDVGAVTYEDDPFYCAAACDRLMGRDGDACHVRCPSGQAVVDGECVAAPGYTVCESIYDLTHVCQLAHLQQDNCDFLRGSVHLRPYGNNVPSSLAFHAASRTSAITSKLRRLGGEMSVHRVLLETLEILENVEQMDGNTYGTMDTNAYGLWLNSLAPSPHVLLADTNFFLGTLGLRWLRTLPQGSSVSFANNYLLVLHDTIRWDRLGATASISVSGTPQGIYSIQDSDFDNGVHFILKQVTPCAEPCGTSCWGPGDHQCQKPPVGKLLFNGTLIDETQGCPNGTYENELVCLPCDASCALCSGPSETECTACTGGLVLQQSQCISACSDGWFAQGSVCVPCDPECTRCNALGCIECHPDLFRVEGTSSPVVCVDECVNATFANTAAGTCAPCPENCDTCTSGAACDLCADGFYRDTIGMCIALTTCDPATEFEIEPPSALSDRECEPLTACREDEEYIVVTATATSDRVCATCDMCDPDTEVRVSGTCEGTVPGQCAYKDLCSPNTCLNGGVCTSINGTSIVCNCTGTGYCGTNCGTEVINGRCGTSSSSIASDSVLAGASVGAAVVLLAVLLVAVLVLRKEGRRALDVYVPSKELRERTKPDEWEIDRDLLTIGRVIGEGHFGRVSQGLLQWTKDPLDDTPARDVAVKHLKGNANGTQEEDDFFKEMALMKSLGRHRHVLSLVGVCTLDDPILLVVEFAELGDLRNFVRGKRATARHGPLLNNTHFSDFGAQIASGMAFLEEHKIVHRDLAARNILVAAGNILKVSDFGLAREIDSDEEYVTQGEGKIAYKWMAPECLHVGVFTSKSDVWSFGITLWEIANFGGMPYPLFDNHEVRDQLDQGYRLPKPDECSDALYAVMKACWLEADEDRPSFRELLVRLAKLSPNDVEYYEDPNAGERPEFMPAVVYERLKEEGRFPSRSNEYRTNDDDEEERFPTYDNEAVTMTPDELDQEDRRRTLQAQQRQRKVVELEYDNEILTDDAAYDLGDDGVAAGAATEEEMDQAAYDLGDDDDDDGNNNNAAGPTEEEMDQAAYDLGDAPESEATGGGSAAVTREDEEAMEQAAYDLGDGDQQQGTEVEEIPQGFAENPTAT